MSPYASLFERLVANTRVEGECWLWTGKTSNGYPKINVWRDGRHQTVRAHRLMLEEVTGWQFPFDEAGHFHCFNSLCIAPHHLQIETPFENLSTRRGYAPCEGRLIPVLFPTINKLMDWAADDAWDGVGAVLHPVGEPCPF